MVEKLDKARRRCDPAAVRIHTRDVHLIGIFVVLTVVDDFVVSALLHRVRRNAHPVNAAWHKNIRLHVVGVGLTANLLDNASKDTVTEVGISPMLSRRITEGKSF